MNGDAIAAAEQRAHDFAEFCDGLETAGFPELARRGRSVARDVLDLAPALAEERSARVAIQEARDRLERLLLARGPAQEAIDDAA